jgi:hypothetical protein
LMGLMDQFTRSRNPDEYYGSQPLAGLFNYPLKH